MDAKTRHRVGTWGAGPASPVYRAVDYLFPTFDDLLRFAGQAYDGLTHGEELIAGLIAGTGHGVAGDGTAFRLSIAADMRAAYDMGITYEGDSVERFAVLMYALNMAGIRNRHVVKSDATEEILRDEVEAIFDRVGLEGARRLVQGHDLFKSTDTRRGTVVLLDAGFGWEDLLSFPIQYSWDFLGADGPYYSVREAIQLHAAGVTTEYAAQMAEVLVDGKTPPVAEYFHAGVPAYYAIGMLRAGRELEEAIGMWQANIPLEYATA